MKKKGMKEGTVTSLLLRVAGRNCRKKQRKATLGVGVGVTKVHPIPAIYAAPSYSKDKPVSGLSIARETPQSKLTKRALATNNTFECLHRIAREARAPPTRFRHRARKECFARRPTREGGGSSDTRHGADSSLSAKPVSRPQKKRRPPCNRYPNRPALPGRRGRRSWLVLAVVQRKLNPPRVGNANGENLPLGVGQLGVHRAPFPPAAPAGDRSISEPGRVRALIGTPVVGLSTQLSSSP